MRKSIFIILIIGSIASVKSYSQATDIGKFFAGGVDDAEKLFEGYLGPYFNAFGTSLTGGWYNTAEAHKLGGFDVTATFNTAFVPSSDRSMNIHELMLERLILAPNNDPVTPTIAGDNEDGSPLNYKLPAPIPETQAFVMPKGTNFPYIPSPMLQLGIGLIKDTEITGRFMPTYKTGDTQIGMWGIGGKHGLKQWIPFIKRVPVLHLTVQYGYTKMTGKVGFDVTPATIGAADLTSGVSWDNQGMEFVTQSHTGNLIISANLPVVCFYGSVGFASSRTDLGIKGNIPVVDAESLPTIGVTDGSYIPEDEGLSFNFTNTDGSTTKPRFNVGMRVKLAVVTLHGDYTYANYSMFTLGLGISFR